MLALEMLSLGPRYGYQDDLGLTKKIFAGQNFLNLSEWYKVWYLHFRM